MGCHGLSVARDMQSGCQGTPAHAPSSITLLQPSFLWHTGFPAPVQAVFSSAGESQPAKGHLVLQPSAFIQRTQEIWSSTALSLMAPFHCALDISQQKIRKSGDALERNLWACRSLKPNVRGLKHTHNFSYNTQSSTVVPMCLLRCVFGTMILCKAHTQAWPISSPPSVLRCGQGRELQPRAASDVLQSLFLWLLAGEETCTKHPLPSSVARELGLTPAPKHAAKANGQREAFSLSTETSPFAATPESQSLMLAGTSGRLNSIHLLKQGQPEQVP